MNKNPLAATFARQADAVLSGMPIFEKKHFWESLRGRERSSHDQYSNFSCAPSGGRPICPPSLQSTLLPLLVRTRTNLWASGRRASCRIPYTSCCSSAEESGTSSNVLCSSALRKNKSSQERREGVHAGRGILTLEAGQEPAVISIPRYRKPCATLKYTALVLQHSTWIE